ncbi:histidine kinase [Streptomyces sp. NBC_01351]|uniref:sensor histidine kinase n=1 Tax=Streptomyces sp. NBC_01351 TaxID=2903833 RepID=UPI002E33EBDC|nr:histidine kinase [Streptomyces sp. NBC_01351]
MPSTSRTRRERSVDLAVVLFAAGLSFALAAAATNPLLMFPRMPMGAGLLRPVEDLVRLPFYGSGPLVGVCGALALWWRRRFPVAVVAVTLGLGLVSSAVTVSAMVALFTVAALRPVRTTTWVAAAAALPVPLTMLFAEAPSSGLSVMGILLIAWTLVALAVGWGLFVRSRRMLVASLTERARRAEEEAARQALEAQLRAREEIAREMHDVLAHRLSLLSVHAGALEFNKSPDPADVGRAAGVIRDNAHQALQDLRMVIGVLSSPDAGTGPGASAGAVADAVPGVPAEQVPVEAPQPVLGDLDRLGRESRAAGMRLRLEVRVDDPDAVPVLAGRTVYRIVQEALTNARKHAPGSAVHVEVNGEPGGGIDVIVRNPVPARDLPAARSQIPGSGRGLIGLAERTSLAGGQLRHGPTGGDFLVQAWIPWSA